MTSLFAFNYMIFKMLKKAFPFEGWLLDMMPKLYFK